MIRRVAIAVVATIVATLVTVTDAGAVGDGSASSRVTRDGRIITSIVTGRPIRYTGSGTAPHEYWITLSDGEVVWLLQLLAQRPDLPAFDALPPLLADGPNGGFDVQLQVVDGRVTGVGRLVPSTATATPQQLARRMITQLPDLPVRTSPPPTAAAVIGEPVFTSFSAAAWSTVVDRSLTVGGVTARVRARPVRFVVHSGDPANPAGVTCDGPGRPFDPEDPASAARQGRRADACTTTYRTATGVGGRRDRWYGDITVVWRAEWTVDGTTWQSLGEIPRILVFARRVVAATTAIEAPS